MIRIGTSGWVYEHWRGVFYPRDLPQEDWLPFFADHFATVEINNTFYHLPQEETVRNWATLAPKDFLFAVKASRYITHVKNLLDPEKPVATFMDRAGMLGDKLGPILFQLPPHWNVNPERLADFIAVLPGAHRYAFEFRDASWYTDEVFQILQENDCAFCIHNHHDAPSPNRLTADYTYIRFHGPGGSYEGGYRPDVLREWAARMVGWDEDGIDVYCYFNNDPQGHAIKNASELEDMVADRR
jgi:uncharacterized protein YecE (DUF72 family)